MNTSKRPAVEPASRPVYSTETGRLCPACGRPVDGCECRALQARAVAVKSDGIVRVSLDTKGRRGKGVTLVTGLALDADALAALARRLKSACGSGGTAKDGTVEIQGDHREPVIAALARLGHTVKRSGCE